MYMNIYIYIYICICVTLGPYGRSPHGRSWDIYIYIYRYIYIYICIYIYYTYNKTCIIDNIYTITIYSTPLPLKTS